MGSALFGGLVQVELHTSQLPSQPARAISRSNCDIYHEDALELGAFSQPDRERPALPSNDFENRPPASPSVEMGAVDILPSIFDLKMNKLRLAACCSMGFLGGLNDSAAGALIPYMETYYDIGYGVVSLIFVGVALGFITAAPFVASLQNRLGLAKVFMLGALACALGFIPIACATPIPVIVVSFFVVGFGIATNLAVYNVWLANHKEASTALGLVHGMYGVGGIVGPLIATSMVSNGLLWSRFYLVPLGFAVFNTVLSGSTFWRYEEKIQTRLPSESSPTGNRQLSAMLLAFKTRVVLIGAMFIFAYQGAEVSISGWIISFLITSRNGEPSRVGYVTSGFWGGITLGRFLLSPLGPRISEKKFVYGLVGGSIVFELLVWHVPNVVGDAVAVAIVGLLLGPVYPVSAVVFTRNLSKKEQASGLAVISAFGSSGGAVAPFTTGILAQVVGTFVLHPMAIGLFTVMIVCWYCIPTPHKRRE